MNEDIPAGIRAVARALVVGPGRKLLLLHAEHAAEGHRFWLTPGGGLLPCESFEDAVRRELCEEVGLMNFQVGPWVWTRRHAYMWNGCWLDQYERFFATTTTEDWIHPTKRDDYAIGHRWWSAQELIASAEDFAPQRLAVLVATILIGQYPPTPIDCGV